MQYPGYYIPSLLDMTPGCGAGAKGRRALRDGIIRYPGRDGFIPSRASGTKKIKQAAMPSSH